MVVDFGMSRLGAMSFAPMYEDSNYGRAAFEPLKISDRLQEKVDDETARFIDEGYKQALSVIKKYRKQLDKVSAELLEIETLDGDQFAKLMGFPKAKRVV